MLKFEYDYDNLTPLSTLTNLVSRDDTLFFDIETTGLSRQKNIIYLIGIGHYTINGLHIVQWFAQNENEESLILNEFLDYASSFPCLVNYNGKSFDIPFTCERLAKYNLTMPDFDSIDIYTIIKPLKKMLSLDDITQKGVERFLNIKREDKYSGGELIYEYKSYAKHYLTCDTNNANSNLPLKLEETLRKLITHNKEDVLNMHYITEILKYNELLDASLQYVSYDAKEYKDYNGCVNNELLLSGLHNLISIPKSFNTFKCINTNSYIMNFTNTGEVKIRIPILQDTLFYYIDNYKDYYYLPSEDICILKSMAGGVLKENRENAKKETCRIKVTDKFLPAVSTEVLTTDNISIKLFRENLKSKCNYIRLSDFESSSDEFKTLYLNELYKFFFI